MVDYCIYSFGNQILALIATAKTEITLFVIACLVHQLLFGRRSATRPKGGALKVKEVSGEASPKREWTPSSLPGEKDSAETLLQRSQEAFEHGDYRTVLRCWTFLKKLDDLVPADQLGNVVEAMQRFKKDSVSILAEIKPYLLHHEPCHSIDYVNDLLHTITRSLDSDVVSQVVHFLPSLGVSADACTFDILISMHFSTRSFDEVTKVAAQMKKLEIKPMPRTCLVLLKTALKNSKLDDALVYFKAIAEAPGNSPPPPHVTAQLIEVACREHGVGKAIDLIEEQRQAQVSADAINSILAEGARLGDQALTDRALELARSRKTDLNGRSFQLLIKSSKGESGKISSLLDDMEKLGLEWSASLSAALQSVCNAALAAKLCEVVKSTPAAAGTRNAHLLSIVIRFFAETGSPEQACAVYEEHVLCLPQESRPILDARTERLLTKAAVETGSQDLASSMVRAGAQDPAKYIATIRACVTKGSLDGVFNVFTTLEKNGKELTQTVYNTVLDACVEIGSEKDVEKWMQRMKADNMTDVVSFNTMIKAYLKWDRLDRASAFMKDMRGKGFIPNHVTYNELIHAFVKNAPRGWQTQVWQLISEMQAEGVHPTRITCSILLKSLGPHSQDRDVTRTMDLISSMKETMDEVLLSSVIEACIRIGKPDMVMQKLAELHGSGKVAVTGPHTFGSLIKAYGHTKDMAGAWRCWREMRSRHVKPTSITIGCMVEAVASNGDVDGAHELVQQLMEDELCKDQVNAVIYCSVLKGYSRARKMERGWAVWREMLAHGIEPSIVTFNAMIDACARNANMDAVPGLVKDMKARGLSPNLITYSTMLKGCCACGDLGSAFAVVDEMKSSTKLRPDEIMYNTLLDGCAQNGLVTEGEKLISQMQAEGVAPSSYTLTVLTKLMGNAKRLDRAFEVVEELSSKYRFTPNAHVHAGLVQACLTCRDASKAEKVFCHMVSNRMQVEPRTWQGIVRAAMSTGNFEQAVRVLSVVLGVSGPHGGAPVPRACKTNDDSFLRETLATLSDKGGQAARMAQPLMAAAVAAGRNNNSSSYAGHGPRSHRR